MSVGTRPNRRPHQDALFLFRAYPSARLHLNEVSKALNSCRSTLFTSSSKFTGDAMINRRKDGDREIKQVREWKW